MPQHCITASMCTTYRHPLMGLQEVQSEHRRKAGSSPVITVKSEDGAAPEGGASTASKQARVLIVAQHVSLL